MSDAVGTLLSVNVGMPKDVAWRGKTVFTGVFKDAVNGPASMLPASTLSRSGRHRV